MLAAIADAMVGIILSSGYIGVFFASMAESFFIPIPAEVIGFTAGFAARSSGSISVLILMCLVTTLGNYVGAFSFYWATRRGAETFLPKFIDRWGPFLMITNEELHKVEQLFRKHGPKMVFLSKFVPVIKNLIDFPAGLSKMPLAQYSIYTISGSLIRNIIYCALGYFVYESKDAIFAFFKPVETLIILALGLAIVLYVGKVLFRIRQLSIERK